MASPKLSKAAAIGVFALVSFLVYYFFVPVERFEYPAYLDVTEKKEAGFDATNASFAFGVLPRGATSTRYFDVNTDSLQRIHIKSSGDIKGWLLISKNNFNLLGKETISISVTVPKGAAPGHYEGAVSVRAYRTIHF